MTQKPRETKFHGLYLPLWGKSECVRAYRLKQMNLNGVKANCVCTKEDVGLPKSITKLLLVLRNRPIKRTVCKSHTISETIKIFRLITQIVPRSSLTQIHRSASAEKSG